MKFIVEGPAIPKACRDEEGGQVSDFQDDITDRDALRYILERLCVVQSVLAKNFPGQGYREIAFEERDKTISVIPGGPKWTFTEAGEIKSLIRDGISYGPIRQVTLR